jgi:hypothetical protein
VAILRDLTQFALVMGGHYLERGFPLFDQNHQALSLDVPTHA